MLTMSASTCKLQMVEVAEQEQLYSKPYPRIAARSMVAAHARQQPRATRSSRCSSSTPAKAGSPASADPKVDEMIAEASAATGDERAKLWSELFAYLHDEVVADVLLFHMVGFSRVGGTARLHADHRDQLRAAAVARSPSSKLTRHETAARHPAAARFHRLPD